MELVNLIGWDICTSELGYCMQPSSYTPNQKLFYWDWETKTAEPKLKELGYKVIRWFTGDGDSFGPLTRVVVVEKDGKREELMYG